MTFIAQCYAETAKAVRDHPECSADIANEIDAFVSSPALPALISDDLVPDDVLSTMVCPPIGGTKDLAAGEGYWFHCKTLNALLSKHNLALQVFLVTDGETDVHGYVSPNGRHLCFPFPEFSDKELISEQQEQHNAAVQNAAENGESVVTVRGRMSTPDTIRAAFINAWDNHLEREFPEIGETMIADSTPYK